ncbi:hypothetical protein IMSAG049_00790 [Clostridiales bacterium]|nr:hypothetical protein IMSAG049_00790 [Clostridiales bacterium]
MIMKPVVSSNLVAVGYDCDTNVLRIQFKSGTYDYYDVPISIYYGLMSASSLGKFHHIYIKNSFKYRKL